MPSSSSGSAPGWSGSRIARRRDRGAFQFPASAVLNYANLGDADLSDADLSDADLRQANLALATVNGTDLSGAQFCNTTMPDGSPNNSNCNSAGRD